MKIKKSTLAAGVAMVLGLGAAGQAAASIYAGSSLLVDDFTLTFTNTVPGVNPSIQLFTFNLSANASLVPGSSDSASANCLGSLLPGSTFTTCGSGVGGTPVLYDTTNLNANVGTVAATPLSAQPLDTVIFYGPTVTDNFANGDSIIDSAQLVGAVNGTPETTSTRQISEAQVATAVQGAANTNIQSVTSLSYALTLGAPGELTIEFQADVDLLSLVDDALAAAANSQANTFLSVVLTGAGSAAGVNFTWLPSDIVSETDIGNGCAGELGGNLTGTVTCLAQTVSEDLNRGTSAGTVPFQSDPYSWDPAATNYLPYLLRVGGLLAGDYTLTLTVNTNAQVSRIPRVPEPGTMLLIGGGLAGLASTIRRRKKG